MAGLEVTKTLSGWNTNTPQNAHIERNLDSAAYEAAHPDDTLVLAGPPRYAQVAAKTNASEWKHDTVGLLPLGMVQQISFQQSKPTQPLMAVGSGRTFYTSGKAQTAWSAARLWVNGRNLLKALYAHTYGRTGEGAKNLKPHEFDDQAAAADGDDFYINLDSELYYMPFGMMCLFRDKVHDYLGAFYVEMCMIGNWSSSVNAGGSQIMEQVSGMADRLLPIPMIEVPAGAYANREAAAAIVGLTATATERTTEVLTAMTGA